MSLWLSWSLHDRGSERSADLRSQEGRRRRRGNQITFMYEERLADSNAADRCSASTSTCVSHTTMVLHQMDTLICSMCRQQSSWNTAHQTDVWEVSELVASSWDAFAQLTQSTHAEVGRAIGGQRCRRQSAKARRSTCFSQTMLVLRKMETLICSMCRTAINMEYTHHANVTDDFKHPILSI